MRAARWGGVKPLVLMGCVFSATCVTETAKTLFCNASEVVGTDQRGQPRCVPAPTGDIELPVCATGLTSDGKKILCKPLPGAPNQDIVAVLDQLDGAAPSIVALLKTPAPVTRFAGVSTTLTTGKFTVFGKQGALAASTICGNQFGSGAHLCLMDELYQSAVDGTLAATSTIAPSWVYMPRWNTSAAFPRTPLQGVADNCGGYSDQTVSSGWRGILVEWGPLPDGTPGFRWHGGDDAYCSYQHPIACCK